MKINIIGDGSAGQRHKAILDTLNHNTIIYGPAMNNPLEHRECDAVVIASPPETHKRYIAHYWDRCHMLCEGPVTHIEGHDTNYIRMTASNWRFVPPLQALSELCTTERPLNGLFWFDHDLRLWRPQTDYKASCYYYTGIDGINLHEVDMALWMMGPPEQCEVAKTTTGRSLGVDQMAILTSHTSGGVSCVMSGWHAKEYTRGLQLVWESGRVERIEWRSPRHDSIVNESYELMLKHWTKAIQNEVGLPEYAASIQDGFKAWQLTQGHVNE